MKHFMYTYRSILILFVFMFATNQAFATYDLWALTYSNNTTVLQQGDLLENNFRIKNLLPSNITPPQGSINPSTAPSSAYCVYLSPVYANPNDVTEADIQLAVNYGILTEIATGTTSTINHDSHDYISISYQLPNDITPGTYYLYYVADCGNALPEYRENNNINAQAITINAASDPIEDDIILGCEGEDVVLTANVPGATSYLWTSSNPTDMTISSPNQASTNISFSYSPTVYTITATMSDGTLITDQVTVIFQSLNFDVFAAYPQDFTVYSFINLPPPAGANFNWTVTHTDIGSNISTTSLHTSSGTSLTLGGQAQGIYTACLDIVVDDDPDYQFNECNFSNCIYFDYTEPLGSTCEINDDIQGLTIHNTITDLDLQFRAYASSAQNATNYHSEWSIFNDLGDMIYQDVPGNFAWQNYTFSESGYYEICLSIVDNNNDDCRLDVCKTILIEDNSCPDPEFISCDFDNNTLTLETNSTSPKWYAVIVTAGGPCCNKWQAEDYYEVFSENIYTMGSIEIDLPSTDRCYTWWVAELCRTTGQWSDWQTGCFGCDGNTPLLVNDRQSGRLREAVITPNNLELKLFPNPASNMISIELNNTLTESGSLQLFNLNGQEIMRREIETQEGVFQKEKIDLQNYPSGMYLLQYKSGSQLISQKLVIER